MATDPLSTILSVTNTAGPAVGPTDAQRDAASASRLEQEAAPRPGVLDVTYEALRDGRVMSWGLIDRVFNSTSDEDEEGIRNGWSYSTVQDEVEKDLSWDHVQYLRENGARGPVAMQNALNQIAVRQDQDKLYARASGTAQFMGQMLAGMADPTALVAGLGVAGLTARTAFGAGALVRAGRPLTAVGAVMAENVAAEVLFTGLQDWSGEVLGAKDYAMAAAGAALLSGAFEGGAAAIGRGTYRQAQANQTVSEARRMAQDATRAETESLRAEGIDGANDAAVAQWRVEQARLAADTVNARTDTPVIPEDLQRMIRDDAEGTPDDVQAQPTQEVKVPEPTSEDLDGLTAPEVAEVLLTPDKVLNVARELESTGDIGAGQSLLMDYINTLDDPNDAPELFEEWAAMDARRTKSENTLRSEEDPNAPVPATLEGAVIVLNLAPVPTGTKSADGRSLPSVTAVKRKATREGTGWRDTTVGSMLDAAARSENPSLVRLRPMIQMLQTRGSSISGAKVTLADTAVGYSQDSGSILQPARDDQYQGLRVKDMTDLEVVDAMGDWAARAVVHEITHQMTQHLIDAASGANRAKLSPQVLRAIETIEDVLARYAATLKSSEASNPGSTEGLTYAGLNAHELVAEAMSNPKVQKMLMDMPASSNGGGKWSNALQELIGAVKRLFGDPDGSNGFTDIMVAIDVLFRARGNATLMDYSGAQATGWPGANMPKASQGWRAMDQKLPLWNDPRWKMMRGASVSTNPADQALVAELTAGRLTSTKEVRALGAGVTAGGRFLARPELQAMVKVVQDLQAKYLPDSHIILSDTVGANSTANGRILTVGNNHVIGINVESLIGQGAMTRTILHEVGHAIFHTQAAGIEPRLLARMKEDHKAFVNQVYAEDPEAVNRRFSLTSTNRKRLQGKALKSNDYNLSFDEYSAEQFVKYMEKETQANTGKGITGAMREKLIRLIDIMKDYFKTSKDAGYLKPDDSFEEFFTSVYTGVERNLGAPVKAVDSQPVNPIAAIAARKNFAAGMYNHAKGFMARQPIDVARLRVLTAKFGGGLSDGLRLATSNNPIMQMVASLVTETTTGASGRRANVAIRKETLKMRLVGNSRLDFETAYSGWKKETKVSPFDDLVSGTARRKFDRLVYEEILARRQASSWRSEVPTVRKAADALQALYERSLAAQKEAGTLGSDRLPEDSVGYLPQSLDGRKLAEADPAEMQELVEHLALHWESKLQWDKRFSKQFAEFYVNRARTRVMDSSSKDFSGTATEGVGVVREALEEMSAQMRDPALVLEATKAKKGLGQTKARLDVDLLADLPSGKKVLDFYEDDTMALAMRYVNRTSGTVALTEFGIPGSDGVKHLKDASIQHAENKADIPTREELEAFDRVMAEIMGQPVPGEVYSARATGIRLFVMLQRLGSMVYTQAAETVNMVHHLGVGATLRGVASLPRILGEVGRVKRGADPANHILTHIEKWGGEFGAHNYKMVFPLDAPDSRLETYVDDPGLLHRLLSAGAYYQSKVTGFRALMAAQHRMAAEQIVMKAARFLADPSGKPDIWLKDMGIDEELAGHIRLNIHEVAQWDRNGNLTGFDVTRVQNPRAAEAFVQAIHRGVNQIIQGSFTGERSAWAHNDWIKVMTQLRTFGITSTEKQWARVREVTGGGKQGYAAATGLLLAQVAMVMPIIAARTHIASIGREDREEFIKKNLHPAALVRSSLNYAALSGMFGDMLDVIGGLGGQLLDKDQQDLIGGRQGSSAGRVTDAVPALGSADAAGRVLSGNATVYSALKQMPFSNTPYLIPVINLFK